MAPLAADIGLPDQPADDWRYHADNEGFGPADGITLASVLRLWRPSRYVEIGSGWTSALALDVNDRFLDGAMKTTFIDPYPERLLGLLRPGTTNSPRSTSNRCRRSTSPCSTCSDPATCCSSTRPTSPVRAATWCTTCSRSCPASPRAVRVHFHDMFYPFEYPAAWVFEGRAWNELYLIRALLSDSTRYRIALWPSMLSVLHTDRLAAALPPPCPTAAGACGSKYGDSPVTATTSATATASAAPCCPTVSSSS